MFLYRKSGYVDSPFECPSPSDNSHNLPFRVQQFVNYHASSTTPLNKSYGRAPLSPPTSWNFMPSSTVSPLNTCHVLPVQSAYLQVTSFCVTIHFPFVNRSSHSDGFLLNKEASIVLPSTSFLTVHRRNLTGLEWMTSISKFFHCWKLTNFPNTIWPIFSFLQLFVLQNPINCGENAKKKMKFGRTYDNLKKADSINVSADSNEKYK